MDTINLKQRTLDWFGRKQFRAAGRGTLWPSEASVKYTNEFGEETIAGKCHRAVFYRQSPVVPTNPPEARSQIIFLLGHQVEAAICEAWKQMGIWENNSVRWEDREKNISGEMDIILREGEMLYGAEIKSFYGYYANKQLLGHYSGRGRNKVWNPGSPKDEHLMQAALYVDHTHGKLAGFKLFYLSRDQMDMAEFNITVDENTKEIFINGIKEQRFTVQDIYDRYGTLDTFIKGGIKPQREFVLNPSQERVDVLHARGDISASAYKDHCSGKRPYHPFQCIGEGTLIKCIDGWKKIEEIKEGDLVLKRDGYKKVLKTLNQGIKNNMLSIKSDLMLPYSCTNDHRILISETNNFYNQKEKLIKNIKFIEAKDFQKDKLQYSVYQIDRKENSFHLSDDELFILSAFISEGHFHTRKETGKIPDCGFTLSVEEIDLAKKICRIAEEKGATSSKIKEVVDTRAEKERRSLQVSVCGTSFVNWIREHIKGRYSYDKVFSNDIMSMKKEYQSKILKYLLIFDGSIQRVRDSLLENHSTTCKEKSLQIQLMYLRNDCAASIVMQKAGFSDFGYCVSEKRESYHVRFFPEATRYHGKIIEDLLFTRIRKVEHSDSVATYDLSMEGLPEFLTQGGIVHNCTYCDYKDHCWEVDIDDSAEIEAVPDAMLHGSM